MKPYQTPAGRAPARPATASDGADHGAPTGSSPLEAFRAAILAALGHAPKVIHPGRLQRFATKDRRGDAAGWCKLFEDLRAGVFGCFRSGVTATWRAAAVRLDRASREAHDRQVQAALAAHAARQARFWADSARRNASLWGECHPVVPGDPVALYLRRRGLDLGGALPAVLRCHPALPYWQDGRLLGRFAAMVAPVVAPDGRMLALHRTFLSADGAKADVPHPKKLTCAAGPLAGAGIVLGEPDAGRIGIAEGIETALAARCGSGIPTVAAYCAGSLAAWQWPATVRQLVIFADADRTGREAADTLRARALAAGLLVRVLVPSVPGEDWCDVWSRRGDVPADSLKPAWSASP